MLDCRGYQSDKPSYNNADTRICIKGYSLLEVISRSLAQSLLIGLMFEYASIINECPSQLSCFGSLQLFMAFLARRNNSFCQLQSQVAARCC